VVVHPIKPELRRWKQEDPEFKASLGYRERKEENRKSWPD
jgi:hypothetical protein